MILLIIFSRYLTPSNRNSNVSVTAGYGNNEAIHSIAPGQIKINPFTMISISIFIIAVIQGIVKHEQHGQHIVLHDNIPIIHVKHKSKGARHKQIEQITLKIIHKNEHNILKYSKHKSISKGYIIHARKAHQLQNEKNGIHVQELQ